MLNMLLFFKKFVFMQLTFQNIIYSNILKKIEDFHIFAKKIFFKMFYTYFAICRDNCIFLKLKSRKKMDYIQIQPTISQLLEITLQFPGH